MENDTFTITNGQQAHETAAPRCVMVMHDIDTSIGTLMEMNDGRFARWVQGGKVTKQIHVMDDDATTHDIDGCYARDIIDGRMTLNDDMQPPDAVIDTEGVWHDRPNGMNDDIWRYMVLTEILASDGNCRVSFVGVK